MTMTGHFAQPPNTSCMRLTRGTELNLYEYAFASECIAYVVGSLIIVVFTVTTQSHMRRSARTQSMHLAWHAIHDYGRNAHTHSRMYLFTWNASA